jgi:hypothetical protein
MEGYVYASESPFFAGANQDGKPVATELPARA